jgi:hypothetical protein
MLQTLEATIDSQGKLKFNEPIRLHDNQRVLVTFLKEVPPISTAQDFERVMQRLAYVKVGRRFSRDELNER